MKNKISVLLVTFVITVIVFFISTNVQKKLINYEPMINCLILNSDIEANQKLNAEMFISAEIPLKIISNVKVVSDFSDIQNLYSKDNIYKGQIALLEQFDTKENLSIYEVEDGKEKISIKISASENGISFSIKENSFVNVYATIRNNYANEFLIENERMTIGDEYEGYTVIKMLDNTKVLGTFNIDGIEVECPEDGNIDTIMVAVTPEEARQINLIREIATFNMTGVGEMNKMDNLSGEIL